jgi:uncharacterized damage-inducible protein DinB
MRSEPAIIADFLSEYARYRATGERAMKQVPDEALNKVFAPETNSIAMLVRHMSGNFKSRFTDFLQSDGEKPWRERDAEFEERTYTRAEIDEMWASGWTVVESQVRSLTESDLGTIVRIRGNPLSVHEALCRSLAHVAYHVGQIVFMARLLAHGEWSWITIPKGASKEYAKNPTREKGPL